MAAALAPGRLSLAAPCADVDGLLCLLRGNLGKADAFITAAEDLIERSWADDEDEDGDGDDSVMRRRNHVE